MNRIDVHCHFLPALDDGCWNLEESLDCLRAMVAAGYSRIFCTPHCGALDFTDLSHNQVAERVRTLQGHADAAAIPIQLRPGGEVRLSPHLAKDLEKIGIPTYGNSNKYVLTDIWENDWPKWATEAVQWLQSRGLTVIIAHPERMPLLRTSPQKIADIAKLGVLFQGNLGPIAGADSPEIVALAQHYLQQNRYFMVGTDGHHLTHLPKRLSGLEVVERLIGKDGLQELTVTNPARLWS